MAWKTGNFILAEGASVRVDFNWQGKYNGVQFSQARPVLDLGSFFPPIPGEREVRTMDYALAGRRNSDNNNVDWIYSVTVQNMSNDFAVFFELTGGGVEP